VVTLPGMTTSEQRREELKLVYEQARGCVKCPQLASTRTTVVFGAGNADADLMFVGEAPGANEDRQGLPFVGQAGKLLDQLLGEIGLSRREVFVTNVLNCRPPGNRDPHPVEIENCQGYLMSQLELIQPKVVCTLGNFATKLLRADGAGITRVHGRDEVRVIGRRAVRVLPIYHPAAALYTPRMLDVLREDFARLPALLALPAPEQPIVEQELDAELLIEPGEAPRAVPSPRPEPRPQEHPPELTLLDVLAPPQPSPEPASAAEPPAAGGVDPPIPGQLGLF
jgi:uracil-DNA glycosylase family 4